MPSNNSSIRKTQRRRTALWNLERREASTNAAVQAKREAEIATLRSRLPA